MLPWPRSHHEVESASRVQDEESSIELGRLRPGDRSAREIAGNVEGALLVGDAGSQIVNRNVDDEPEVIDLDWVLAPIDVTYFNSMIEAFWRSLKHAWLYLHGLETVSEVRRLIAIYVEAHNVRHTALRIQRADSE
jgi:hypothetical protein